MIHVAEFADSDAQHLSEVANKSYEDAFAHILADNDLRKHREKLSAHYFSEVVSQGDIIFVAKIYDQIAGFIQFGPAHIPEVKIHEGDLELDKLYIDPDSQGRGVGRKLLEVALVDPQIAKAPEIYLLVWNQNDRAIKLYRSFKFEEVGMRKFPTKDGLATNLIMVRNQTNK